MPKIYFLYLSAVSPFIVHFFVLATQGYDSQSNILYHFTIAVLQESFRVERMAYKDYIGYTSKAISEKYLNIYYLFYAFFYSEKVHADNYK
jgi:hypothetical protein